MLRDLDLTLTVAGARLAGLRNACQASAKQRRALATDVRAPKEYPHRSGRLAHAKSHLASRDD
jgi:predicted nucleotidyltransferase